MTSRPFGLLLLFGLIACGGYRPPPVVTPPIVVEPPPVVVPPLDQIGDFRSFWCSGVFYIIGDQPEPRPECLEQYKARGYRDAWVTVTRDAGLPGIAPFDYLGNPSRYRVLAQRFIASGIRVHPVIGCEDAEAYCRRVHGAFPAWLDHVVAFVAATDDLTTSYVIGVEVREWATWDQLLQIIQRVSAVTDRPIIPHFNQRVWGPSSADPWSGGGQIAFWRRAIQLAGGPQSLAAALQYAHDRVEDSGGGFVSTPTEVREFTRAIVDRLGPLGVAVIASEYAYRMPMDQASALGRIGRQAGAAGCMNGC